MNPLQLDKLDLISKKAFDIHQLLEIYLQNFDHPLIRLFDDVVLKFVIFYELNILGNPIQGDDIEILTDTDYLISLPSVLFLYELATCIERQINYEDDPLFCIRKSNLFNKFIQLINLCCKDALRVLDRTYTLNKVETDFISQIKKTTIDLKDLLSFFVGEWYDNEEIQIDSDNIPAEFSWYREGEE